MNYSVPYILPPSRSQYWRVAPWLLSQGIREDPMTETAIQIVQVQCDKHYYSGWKKSSWFMCISDIAPRVVTLPSVNPRPLYEHNEQLDSQAFVESASFKDAIYIWAALHAICSRIDKLLLLSRGGQTYILMEVAPYTINLWWCRGQLSSK